jgi:hypothetical protein
MDNTSSLPADGIAERIVRHFQAEGFVGISEALIVRISLKKGERTEVDSAFMMAAEQEKVPPVRDYFEIRPCGHFSDFRNFAAARAAIDSDFTVSLRRNLPRIYFDPAPVLIDDALATGTKYDAMVKLRDNVDGRAFVTLLNDPDSSFLEYLGTHHGSDWQKIIDDFEATAVTFGPDADLF